MLPATFDDDPKIRLSRSAVGIFAGIVLAAGFSLAAIIAFLVPNPLFQTDSIYLPSVISCAVGLLTVFYDLLLSSRYQWTIATTLVIIVAGVSTIIYGLLLIWTQRRINLISKNGPSIGHSEPLRPTSFQSSTQRHSHGDSWADPAYYQNYVQNMFPAASPVPPQSYDPVALTEEEQQRQQMLNLLLQNDPRASTPDLASTTYRLDWQDRDQDDLATPRAPYAQRSGSSGSERSSAYPTGTSLLPDAQDLRSWNGVWRGAGPLPGSGSGSLRAGPSEMGGGRSHSREERRREIERGC